MLDRRSLSRASVIIVLLLLAIFALPPLMSGYYTDTMTQVAIYSIVTLGLGLLVGRVGLYSLGQLAVLMIGAWVGARLLFATSQPYILVLIEAALVTAIIGSLITLPALRLRGLYLALITLMLAGGVIVVAATLNFPNGGGGFSGYDGALLAGADRELFSIDFPIQNSISLLAVVLMGGAFSLAGAVIAAFLQAFLPALLQNWGVANDWLIILFGLGVMQVLATAPGGVADQFPKDMKRLYRLISRLWRRPPAAAPQGGDTA